MKRICSILLVLAILLGLFSSGIRPAEVDAADVPSAASSEIEALFSAKSEEVHPRILADGEDFARIRKLLLEDDYMQVWYARIYNYCVEQLAEPVSVYEIPDGVRLLSVSRKASYRITWMSFLYQISGDRRFADRALAEMLAVCAFPDWNPSHFLDVGQMAYGVGIGYDWLYHYMTAAQRKTIAEGLYRHSVGIEQDQSKSTYLRTDSNWNPWCNAGLSIAACAIFESYPAECSYILSKAVTNVQSHIKTLAPLGSFPEGPGYHQLGTGFLVILMDTLDSVLGTDFGLSDMEGVKEVGRYLLTVNGNVNTFNFGDGNAAVMDGAMLHWFANRYHMPELSVYQRSIQSTSVMYDEFLAMLWYSPTLVEGYGAEDRQLDQFLLSNAYESIASFRGFQGDETQIYAAIKSGDNSNSHTDLDVGDFVLEALGERWITEMGSDNYNLPGYSSRAEDSKRWTYYRKRAEGQNVLVVNPNSSGGQAVSAKCQITEYESAYDGGYAVVDLYNAYQPYGTTAAKRGLLLFDNRSKVLVSDELQLSSASTVYWFAHTEAEVSLSSDGKTATLTKNGKTFYAQILSPANGSFTIMNAEALDTSPNPSGQNSTEGYRKLAICLKNVKNAKISVLFAPAVDSTLQTDGSLADFPSLLKTYAPGTQLQPNEDGIYEISSAEQLFLLAEKVHAGTTFSGKTIQLVNDIDLKGRSFTPIGGNGTSTSFRGTFDGGNHVIQNLFIYEPNASAVGLFGRTSKATLRNFGIESGTVFCGEKSAAVVGLAADLTMENCFNRAKVISSKGQCGGMVGQMGGTNKIDNCYNHAEVRSATGIAGGIVGYAASATTLQLSNSYHAGTLSDSLGRCGLIGFYNTTAESLLVKQISVSNCYSTYPIKSSAVTDNASLETYSGNATVSPAELPAVAVSLGSAFLYDCEYENSNLPVLQWQCDTTLPEDLVLTTSAQLRLLAYRVNTGTSYSGRTVKLGNNIDLDSVEWVPIGGNTTANGSKGKIFKGTFDGQGYAISNLSVTANRFYVGFFGSVQGTVKNLGINSGRVIGQKKVASLAGYFAGSMSNCYSRASVTGGSHTGGLIGASDELHLTNCYQIGDVSANLVAGGLVGWISASGTGAELRNCYCAGAVSGTTVGSVLASSSATGVTVQNCYGLTGNAVVGDPQGVTTETCEALSSDALKTAYTLLGSAYTGDNTFTQNRGYPLLVRCLFPGEPLPALVPDEAGVYHITSEQELRSLAYMVNVEQNCFSKKVIHLDTDIDLGNREWVAIGGNIGNKEQRNPYFSGIFEGNGHKISNLCISTGNSYVGLFGSVSGGTIQNVGIESGTVVGWEKVAAIAGNIRNGGVIRNCYSRATVSGRTIVGAISGMISRADCLVENCYQLGSVTGYSSTGALIGYLSGDTTAALIQNCYNGGIAESGIVGCVNASVTDAELRNCYTIDTAILSKLPNQIRITDSAQVSASQLRSYATILGESFDEDYFVQNRLFPVLNWETQGRTSTLPQENGVYHIDCADDLRVLSYLVRKGNSFTGKTVELRANIDLEGKAWVPIGGKDETKTYTFKGTFDGMGYVIRNLRSYEPETGYAGLFGSVSDGTVQNVGIESGIVIGRTRSAAFCAAIGNNTTLRNCYSKIAVYSSSNTGSFVGMVNGKNCLIENCYNTGFVSSKSRGTSTGGMVGYVAGGCVNFAIRNAYNVGSIYGLIGSVNASATNCTLSNSYSVHTVDIVGVRNQLIIDGSAQISAEALRSYASVLGDAFDANTTLQNQGYPVLAWETGKTCIHVYELTKLDSLYHLLTCKRCGLAVEVAHSYSEGFCICGEQEIKEPMENTSLKLNHSLDLASDISVNLVIPKTTLAGFDMETVYVESTIDRYTGNELTSTDTLCIAAVEKGNYYYFTVTGMTAIRMNDRIRSVLYGTKDGQPYYSPVDDYAIADYAYAVLNMSGTDDAVKTLCADLLRYGSKAQIYKKYRTDSLADAEMTEAHKAYLSNLDAVTFGNNNQILSDVENAPITWVGKTLNLDSKVELKFVFNPTKYSGTVENLSLRVSYQDIEGKEKQFILERAELYSEATGYYFFTVDTLLAAELRAVVSVQIFEGDTPVSCTMQFSADTYGNNQKGDLLTLCKALVAYSDSAKAYFIK